MPSLALGCAIVFMLVAGLTNGSPISTRGGKSKYSIRREKVEEFQLYMNSSVNPCDDFFEFVCGEYSNVGTVLHEIIADVGKQFVKELITDDETDTAVDKKVKNFYRSCISTEYNADYISELKALVDEFGQMPALLEEDEWQEDDFDWTITLASIVHKTGLPIIFKVDVLPDMDDNSIARVSIVECSLPLESKKAYYGSSFKEIHDGSVIGIANNLIQYLELEEELAKQIAAEIFEFERELSLGLRNYNDTVFKNVMSVLSIDELENKYLPHWNAKFFIELVMDYQPSHVMIQDNYVHNALEVLNRKPKRIVANYIFYKYLETFMRTDPYNSEALELGCKDTAAKYLLPNLHNMLYRKYPIRGAEKAATSMWGELKRALSNVAKSQKLDWILDDTRSVFLNRIAEIQLQINSYEGVDFDFEYAAFNPSDEDYIGNLNSLLTVAGNRLRAKINEPAKYDYGNVPAMYTPFEHRVLMDTTFLLSDSMWSKSYPQAFNYASLGYVLAHEMAHGFDDVAVHYDHTGNGHDWWDPISASEFKDRVSCFVRQYRNHVFHGRPLHEWDVQAENIADNGGVRLAYDAYMNWYESASQMQQKMEWLPGFNYTEEQLFFISYGHSMCASPNPALIDFSLLTDPHSPEKLRVNVPLSNFDEFSMAFNCPIGSNMNPVQKCKLF